MAKAIKVTGLSKLYRLGVKEDMQDTAVQTIVSMLKSPARNLKKFRSLTNFDDVDFAEFSARKDILWALRDVSFEINQGEVVGIIGMNGAGKSTLLKILSRITPPTRGRIEIHGRVYSLLEVGTGFHPELSGRENVYLNGTILGMKKHEINKKFDEIVAFSGIEKFIDTPTKRYSSGMTVRLAFAVAAHLEPEILIVDEVLAVGDAAFQKKCLNKMQDVGQLGATVLFVSHSMPSISRLCARAILLEKGRVLKDGLAHEVVNAYLTSGLGTTSERSWLADPASAPGTDTVRAISVRVKDETGKTIEAIDIDKPVGLELAFHVRESGHVLLPNLNLCNEEGTHLFTTIDVDPTWRSKPRPAGRYVATAWIPGNLLSEGTFYVEPAMMTPAPFVPHFKIRDAITFQVVDNMSGNGARGDWAGVVGGAMRPLLQWETEYQGE